MDGDVAGGNVGNHLGNEERRELRAVVDVLAVVDHLIFESPDTSDTHAIDNADAVLVFGLQVHSAIFDSLDGCNHGHLRVAVNLACFLAVEIFVYVKVLDFATEMGLAL